MTGGPENRPVGPDPQIPEAPRPVTTAAQTDALPTATPTSDVGPSDGARSGEPPTRGTDAGTTAAPRRRRDRSAPGPTPAPEDAGTAADAWHRLRRLLTIAHPRSQILAGLLCALLGFALVAQIRHTEVSGLEQLSEQELLRVLDDVDSRNERLQEESEQLAQDERDLESGTNQREAALAQARERETTLSILAGTVPVTGPGITIEITGDAADSPLTAATAVTLVQELRDAGAESIQFDEQRIVVHSAFTEAADGTLLVDGAPLELPVTVTAIGEPQTMDVAMNIPGGVADTIRNRGGDFTVETHDSVDIEAVVAPPEGVTGAATETDGE